MNIRLFLMLSALIIVISCKKKEGIENNNLPPHIGDILKKKEGVENNNLPLHVGDISYDSALDTSDFTPCHESLVYQYYNFGNSIQYEGEKAAIIKIFKKEYSNDMESVESGYITIRFMVNCKGKTGRFRLEQMDFDYNEKIFSKSITHQILKITKSLSGWKVGEYNNNNYDYYQYLTFKIIDSEIIEILP